MGGPWVRHTQNSQSHHNLGFPDGCNGFLRGLVKSQPEHFCTIDVCLSIILKSRKICIIFEGVSHIFELFGILCSERVLNAWDNHGWSIATESSMVTERGDLFNFGSPNCTKNPKHTKTYRNISKPHANASGWIKKLIHQPMSWNKVICKGCCKKTRILGDEWWRHLTSWQFT